MTEFAEHEEQKSGTKMEGKVLPWAKPQAAALPVAPSAAQPVVTTTVNIKRDNLSTLKPKEAPPMTPSQRRGSLFFGGMLIASALVFTWFMATEQAWQLGLFVVTFLFVGLRMFYGGWRQRRSQLRGRKQAE
jgi:hypothetical protein